MEKNLDKSFCIVVVTYNRLVSLKRLLCSLSDADYNNANVDLLISIDRSEIYEEITKFAEDFNWQFGRKNVRVFEERQGLRKHILQCGDVAFDYDAIAIFEDDIVVSKDFFNFCSEAVEKYQSSEDIAGISLYAPEINEMVELPFTPDNSIYDAYFLQSSQSWGQCWTKSMWGEFRKWYNENTSALQNDADMPEKVYSWPESSWKKYHMKFIVSMNKTWVYPYVSFTTNCSEAGTHNKSRSAMFQVPLSRGKKDYCLPEINSGVSYDVYFERNNIRINEKNVCMDLYGSRQHVSGVDLLATPRVLRIKPIQEYSLSFKPHELNIINGLEGADIRLYDLTSLEGGMSMLSCKKKINLKYYSNLPWFYELSLGLSGAFYYMKKKISTLFS